MAQSPTKYQATQPISEATGTPSQPFREWLTRVSKSVPIVGSGSPEGVLEAPQYSVFIDESTPSTPTTYHKMLAEIGGDRSKGWYAPAGGATDHGALTGLGDDDHSQYHNDTRGDARYYTQAQVDAALSSKAYAEFYETTGGVTSVSTTATTLNLSSTRINSGDFALSSNEVTVNKTGNFLITFDLYFNTGGSSRSEYSLWIEDDSSGSFTEITATRAAVYQRGYDSGQSASITFMHSVTTGDKFRARIVRTDGGATTGYQDDNGTRFSFLEI